MVDLFNSGGALGWLARVLEFAALGFVASPPILRLPELLAEPLGWRVRHRTVAERRRIGVWLAVAFAALDVLRRLAHAEPTDPEGWPIALAGAGLLAGTLVPAGLRPDRLRRLVPMFRLGGALGLGTVAALITWPLLRVGPVALSAGLLLGLALVAAGEGRAVRALRSALAWLSISARSEDESRLAPARLLVLGGLAGAFGGTALLLREVYTHARPGASALLRHPEWLDVGSWSAAIGWAALIAVALARPRRAGRLVRASRGRTCLDQRLVGDVRPLLAAAALGAATGAVIGLLLRF